jgi:hypothetical protein
MGSALERSGARHHIGTESAGTAAGRRAGGQVDRQQTVATGSSQSILSHTDGVPLFIEELTKSVLESKLVRETDDGYVLDYPLPKLAIPTTLRDSLVARLDRLAPIREIAQIGACIGRESLLRAARTCFATQRRKTARCTGAIDRYRPRVQAWNATESDLHLQACLGAGCSL